MSEKEIQEIVKAGDFTNVVAVYDNKPGCPENRDKDGYWVRCNLGVHTCAVHGPFPVKYKD